MLKALVVIIFLMWMDTSFLSALTMDQTASTLIETIRFDWDHSRKPTIFSLIHTAGNESSDQPDLLVIQPPAQPKWTLKNQDDAWASLAETGLPEYRNRTKRLFFVPAGRESNARIYLVLKGENSGCCVGRLTILTPGEDGVPKIVFHESSYEFHMLTPTGRDALKLIGRSSDSEAWAVKNAQSYDPYRIYLLQGSRAAVYDLDLSKEYTESHYCQWHGPEYDERFAAIGPTVGSAHCQVMTRKAFDLYFEKHPQFFGKRNRIPIKTSK